ncbi:hypothetical protein LCGC14_2337310, partial [marine sediment metagenome]
FVLIVLLGATGKISQNETYQALETRAVDKVLNFTFEKSQRDYMWEEVISEWKTRPWIGVGLGKSIFYRIKSRDGDWYTAKVGNLHNSYLELGLKIGAIGLLLFLLLQGVLITRCLRASMAAKGHLPFVFASIVFVIAMLLQTGIQPLLTEPNSTVLIYLLIGAALSLTNLKIKKKLEDTGL